MYQRPNFPMTWARNYGKGRVFYTSMGHREDVWSNPMYQGLLLGALGWATGRVEADIEPNFQQGDAHGQRLPTDRSQSRTKSLCLSRYALNATQIVKYTRIPRPGTRTDCPRQVGLHRACDHRVDHISDQGILAEDPEERFCQPRRSQSSKKTA